MGSFEIQTQRNERTALLFKVTSFLIFVSCFHRSNAPNPFVGVKCNEDATYNEGSQLETNVNELLQTLANGNLPAVAYNTSQIVDEESPSSTVYGMLQCRGDTSPDFCSDCANRARNDLQTNCHRALGGMVWYGKCFLRWQNYNFTGKLDYEDSPPPRVNPNNVSEPSVFGAALIKLYENLTNQILGLPDQRYAMGDIYAGDKSNHTIYALAQCWRDISTADCKTCLQKTFDSLYEKYGRSRGSGKFTASCMFGYDIYRFYYAAPPPPSVRISPPPRPSPSPPNSERKSKLATVVAAVGGSLLLILVLSFGFFLCLKRRRKDGSLEEITSLETGRIANEYLPLVFSMDELRAATNNFDENLKIGRGGFGEVYKGTLPNGKVIAVKKLYGRSVRDKKEFMNEIDLLAKIQHRNLVGLLGCCLEDPHRILVFEYLPNNSLEKFIFGSEEKKLQLDWLKRYNIIIGVAKGLQYLHEDSKHKIIHRDIKAGNVLLDAKLDPKIADFGLAKLFTEDQSKIHTILAGTRGYIAPEYAIGGELSSKADVFSFGVLILEIISGKQHRHLESSIHANGVVGWARGLYERGKLTDMVDETMEIESVKNQVMSCIEIGLLCTQADSSLRPTMSRLIFMLSSTPESLPRPAQPAFRAFDPGDSNGASGPLSGFHGTPISEALCTVSSVDAR